MENFLGWKQESNDVINNKTGFPGGSVVRNLPVNAGDMGSIPGLGRCPGEGNDYPLHYSCLKNPMDRGASRATVDGVTKRHDWATKKQQQNIFSLTLLRGKTILPKSVRSGLWSAESRPDVRSHCTLWLLIMITFCSLLPRTRINCVNILEHIDGHAFFCLAVGGRNCCVH